MARYKGGQIVRAPWDGEGFFVGTWLTKLETNRICLAYPMREYAEPAEAVYLAEYLAPIENPDVTALILIDPWGTSKIIAVDGAYPSKTYEVSLEHLCDVLNRRIPWWPEPMRSSEKLALWSPDGPRYRYPATYRFPLRAEVVKRIIATEPAASPIARILSSVLWKAQEEANRYAQNLIEAARREFRRITVPVFVDSDMEPQPQEPGDADAKQAWRDLYSRTDPDAVVCVRNVRPRDRHSPVGEVISFDSYSGLGPAVSEWVARLKPSPATAGALALLHRSEEEADVLIDARTGMWVVDRRRLSGGSRSSVLRTYAPTRLRTSSPVAELILDQTAWIRTSDGVLYMAPQPRMHMITWGYRGNGPSRLAGLVVRLLDDVSAELSGDLPDEVASRRVDTFKMIYLATQKWPDGTVFSRANLEEVSTPGPENPIGWHPSLDQ